MTRTLKALLALLACASFARAQATPQPAQDPCAEVKTQAARAESRLRDWPALARKIGRASCRERVYSNV